MLRLLLLRFLPRRLMPLLLLVEAIRFVRRLQRRDRGVIDGQATVVPPRTIDRGR